MRLQRLPSFVTRTARVSVGKRLTVDRSPGAADLVKLGGAGRHHQARAPAHASAHLCYEPARENRESAARAEGARSRESADHGDLCACGGCGTAGGNGTKIRYLSSITFVTARCWRVLTSTRYTPLAQLLPSSLSVMSPAGCSSRRW